MNSKVVKEIFIIVLLMMVIVFAICILFYDCLPISSNNINPVEYKASKEVENTLEDIKVTVGTQGESNSLLKSYSVNASDLNQYASDNSYESGKKDPFAEYAEPVTEEIVSTSTSASEVKTEEPQTIGNVIANNTVDTTKNTVDNKEVSQNKVENNTVANKVENKVVTNTVQNTVRNTSTTGKYFEKPNSK